MHWLALRLLRRTTMFCSAAPPRMRWTKKSASLLQCISCTRSRSERFPKNRRYGAPVKAASWSSALLPGPAGSAPGNWNPIRRRQRQVQHRPHRPSAPQGGQNEHHDRDSAPARFAGGDRGIKSLGEITRGPSRGRTRTLQGFEKTEVLR
jgi:hypothetical protein